ncbi:MAG: hypothetical protein AUK47_06460 [Deltaproteobacteria bacterium CG2_30_63_29]|nr:MAG: hypothetical protein AUK47_06460 [Deltaproteobacteria bacterium CG2_30_63_29]
MKTTLRLILLIAPLLFSGCDDSSTTKSGADSSTLDLTGDAPIADTHAADAPSDQTVGDSGEDQAADLATDTDIAPDGISDGTTADTSSELTAEVAEDVPLPTCTGAGVACNTNGPCCPGNVCVDGVCRGCVSKGGFCTWAAADRCCSGRCDGDSCLGFDVGEDCSSNSDCQLNDCRGGLCGCGAGNALCNGACVDIEYNDNHCGGCGIVCGLDQVCFERSCICDPNQSWLTDCGDVCVDIRIDEGHCGACDVACRADQICRFSACDCTTGVECNGACVFTSADPNSCGACGTVCPTATPLCSAGACRCDTGLTMCPTGCEDLQSDRLNCGTCGHACNGNKQCVAGVC